MLIKKLMGSEEAQLGSSQFAREMLQIISDVREPLEIKQKQLNNMFGEQEDEGNGAAALDYQTLGQKYLTKFEEAITDL